MLAARVGTEVVSVRELEEMYGPGLVHGLLREPVKAQIPTRHNAYSLLARPLHPEAAGPHVRFDVHRIELVPCGRADHGLEAPEKRLYGLHAGTLSFHATPEGSVWG